MSHSLECAGSIEASDAIEGDIHRAFDQDDARGEFVILTAPSGDFIQAANEGDEPFTVEHRVQASGEQFQILEVPKEEVRRMFLAYLRGDDSWRTGRPWQPLEATKKKGCAAVILLTIGIGVLALWA